MGKRRFNCTRLDDFTIYMVLRHDAPRESARVAPHAAAAATPAPTVSAVLFHPPSIRDLNFLVSLFYLSPTLLRTYAKRGVSVSFGITYIYTYLDAFMHI